MMIITMIKFVVSGHVDHGKSTLCGHLLYMSGYISGREMDKLREEAKANKRIGWEFSYVLDIYESERQTGKTLEFNKIKFEFDGKKYLLIDTPGHKLLIPNLIKALNNEDQLIGCLVVSAKENEFESGISNGQTKEDIILIRTVGIEHLIVIINKMDIYNNDVNIFNERKNDIDKIIKKMGFKSINYIDISAITGYNIKELLNLINNIWNKYYSNIIDKNIDEIYNKYIYCKIKIINCENILSGGYECILHLKDKEYEVVLDNLRVVDMKTGELFKQKYGKINDVVMCKIRTLDNNEFLYNINNRIIIRKNDMTIGFGVIEK